MPKPGARNPTVFTSAEGLKQTPTNAFRFRTEDSKVNFRKNKDEKKDKSYTFEMVGNTGGIIENHWWWGNCIFDLSGVEPEKEQMPILYRHDDRYPMGYSTNYDIDERGLVFTDEHTKLFEHKDYVQDFFKDSEEGLEYQSSVGVGEYKSIEFVKEGESVEVNGRTYDNIDTVFRKWTLRECSVCLFGADSNTSATGSSSEYSENTDVVDLSGIEIIDGKSTDGNFTQNNDPEEIMNWDEAKTQFAADLKLYEQGIVEPLNATITDYKAKNDELTNSLEKANDKFEAKVEQYNQLEKDFTIFKQTQANDSAKSIFSSMCAEAGVPEKLIGKVEKQINFSARIDEEGKLDEEGLKEDITTEFNDWKDVFSAPSHKPASIQGGGSTEDFKDEKVMSADECDALIDRLNPNLARKE